MFLAWTQRMQVLCNAKNKYRILENENRKEQSDKEEQRQLAKMGWHCITVWECELKPKVREQTLKALAFTLNHIYLQDHSVSYQRMEEENEHEGVAEPTPEK